MTKLKYLLLALILIAAPVLYVHRVHSTPTLPQPMQIDRTGKWLQNSAEASFFMFGGVQYYVYTDRNLSGSSKTMKIVRFSDNVTISTFGTGYGCMDTQVNGSTLYVIASSCNMDFAHKGNSIVYFTSTDLTTWSGPTNLLTMNGNTQVYNVTVTKNTGTNNYILGYEILDNFYTGFTTKYQTSSNLTSWSGTGNVVEGYGCPELQYINGVYYQWVCEAGSTHSVFMVKSTDLSTWTYSRMYTLRPKQEYEDINVSDVDVIENGGDTYIMYSTGDQNTYFRQTYATFDGTLQQFVDAYYQGP